MTRTPVVLLEFNELTPALMDRFIESGMLPHFARLRAESLELTTHAEDAFLEPWIQWVTVHTGLPYEQHKVFRLDEGHKLAAPRVWDVLSEHGLSSWVCGSMNVHYEADTRATVLPDPWCTKVEPNPAALAPYYRFVQRQVQDHTKGADALNAGDYMRFILWMARNGLSAGTVSALATQLAKEAFGSKEGWKRVALLDRLQFDVFAHYYRRLSPAFSTLFLNSTAHYQHAYWDELEPEKYPNRSQGQRRDGEGRIAFGYKSMDALIGRLLDLVGDDAIVVLCTALSQTAYPEGGTPRYRPVDFEKLAAFAGVEAGYSVAPVMTDQFHVECRTPEALKEAEQALTALRIDGAPFMRSRIEGGSRLFVSCGIRKSVAKDTPVVARDGRTLAFSELFYRIPTAKLADHHPDGILWMRLPSKLHRRIPEPVPLTAVAPTLLSLMAVTPPAHMNAPIRVGERSAA